MCNKTFVEIGMVILLIAFVVVFNYGGCINVGDDSSGSSTPLATSAPSVATLPAGEITLDSATLNGLVNPNGLITYASFQWGPTNAYGNLTPSQSIGNGNSNLNVVTSLSGLTFGTTYYFRLRASNSRGITYSSGLSFNTLLPGTPPIRVASPNPGNGTPDFPILNIQLFWLPAAYTVSYDVYFGTTTSPTYKANVTVTNYTPDTIAYSTTYYWRIDSKNSVGVTTGDVWSFTTQAPQPPVVSTYAASNVLSSTATLNGAINPMALTTTAYFEYGIAPSYGPTAQVQPQPIGSGLGLVDVYADISGLLPNTTYNFKLRANNAAGTTYGLEQSFTTAAIPPSMTTVAASNILFGSATLNGTANPNGSATTIYFWYGISPSYNSFAPIPSPPQPIGSGQSSVSISATLTALSGNNTVAQPYNVYRFIAVGNNNAPGSPSYASNILSFTTRNRPLSLDTLPSSAVASTNYPYGYRFTPTVNGQITALGRYFTGTGNAIIRLWNETPTQLATVTVSPSTAGWQWANITPVNVISGTYYRVAVDCTSGYVNVLDSPSSFTYPLSKGNITITAGDCYINNATPGTYPSLLVGTSANSMYGWPDIEFLPNQ